MYVGNMITYCGGYNNGDGVDRDALIIQSLEKSTGAPLSYDNVCGQSGFGTGGLAPMPGTATKTL